MLPLFKQPYFAFYGNDIWFWGNKTNNYHVWFTLIYMGEVKWILLPFTQASWLQLKQIERDFYYKLMDAADVKEIQMPHSNLCLSAQSVANVFNFIAILSIDLTLAHQHNCCASVGIVCCYDIQVSIHFSPMDCLTLLLHCIENCHFNTWRWAIYELTFS